MDLRGFLERVLPDQGSGYFGAAASGGKLQQTKLNDINALEKYIRANVRGKDVYYATGTYSGRRDGKSAELKKALYIDLDCGAGPNKYPSKRDAAMALAQFCKNHFLPPSIIVDSGGGLHAYWCLDAPIPPARWVPLADRLKALCESAGLLADPVVTADVARILRVPGTINFKSDTPRSTKVFHASPSDYAISQIEARLGAQARPIMSLAVSNDDLSEGVYSKREYSAKHILKHCPMFADALATQGAGLPESLWTQQLHVLAYCEDGEEYVHEISRGYEGYAEAETRMKWNQRLSSKSRVGPTLCDTFAQWSPACQTCPHRGQIKTPLQLGVARDHSLPYPYNQDDRGVFLFIEQQDDRGVTIRERLDVTTFPIEDFTVIYGDGMTFLRFTAKVSGVPHNVEINYADVTEKRSCLTVLSNHHVILSENEYRYFRDFMSAWTKKMQESKRTQRMWTQLGWVENPKGFALANEVLLCDGSTINNIHHDRYLAGMYQCVGERDPWITIARQLTSQKRHAIEAIICTAFAAPLVEFMRDSSAALAFVSSKSGSGKTTALQVAQAVWGNPRTAMNQLDDTQASIFRKLGYINNLPAYWDEVRAKDDVQRFVKMIFQMTGGKERSRLTQNVEMREASSWNTILTVASNESIADHTDRASQDSEAGRARVFEVIVPTIEERHAQHSLINALVLGIYDNYGVVGAEYASFLVKNQAAVKVLVTAAYEKLGKKLLRDSSERFWLTSVTGLYVAARLANKLAYTSIDLEAFDEWLFDQFEQQRQDRVREYGNEEDQSMQMVMDFISHHRSQVYVCEKLISTTGSDAGRTYQDVKHGEIAAFVALDDSVVRLNRRVFHDWLYEAKIGTPKMIMRRLKHTEVRSRLEPGPTGARVRSYDVYMPPGSFDTVVDAPSGSTE
jgi:hypothetical protein